MKLDHWLLAYKWLKGILLVDDLQFSLVALFQFLKDEAEHVCKKIENLKVMFFDCHLHIEACKLTEMAICEGVLRSKYRSNLKHSLHIGT